MDYRKKSEELFETIVQTGKGLAEIPIDCSQGETGTLLYLMFEEDGVSATKLSEILKVTMPRVVSLINNLELKELIMRKSDNNDKRKSIIYITEKGKKSVLNKKEEAINSLMRIVEKLEDDEIEQYIKLTKKIGKIIVDTKY